MEGIALVDSPVAWAGKAYPEIDAVASETGSVLVVPIGSIEQHGHHLPVATDTLLASAVATAGAEGVADELPVLVAPPVYPGYSPHHLSFGGTLTLGFEHLLAMVVDTVESGFASGFDAVLMVNGHGGNIPLLGAATSVLGVAHSDHRVAGISYFELAAPFIDEIRDSDPGGMGHAGEFETSLMLHLYPNLADQGAMTGTPMDDPSDYTIEDMFSGGPLSVYRPFTEYSESGAIGTPELATSSKGETLLDRLAAELGAVLVDFHEPIG